MTASSLSIDRHASAETLHALARDAWAAGDAAGAFDLLRRAVAVSLDLELLNDFGVAAVDMLGVEDARAILHTVLAVDPTRVDAAENLAALNSDGDAASGERTIVLGSFCNQSLGAPVLAMIDPATLAVVPMRIDDAPDCLGITGITADDERVYAALQGVAGERGRSAIAVLDRSTFAVASVHELPTVDDIHSLSLLDGVLYAVSTGTNELVSVALDRAGEPVVSVVWTPDPTLGRGDHHHLNAVGVHRGDLVVSGFGRKEGDRWTSARRGFVYNVTRGTVVVGGVAQPHSIAAVDESLAYCASLERRVETLDGGTSDQLPGYARGLCVVDGKVFAGTSRGRKVSKSTGQLNHGSAEGEQAGECTVVRLSAATLEIEATATLSSLGHELYELLPLTVGGAAPAESPAPPAPETVELMKREWDERARENAMHFIASGRDDWDEGAFSQSGRGNVNRFVVADRELICGDRDPKTMRALEIGCGIGRMTEHLAGFFGEVAGVDVSGEMIRRGRERLAHLDNVRLLETNGCELPFADESLDFVFSFIVFQHVPSREAVLANLRDAHRVLKPGCVFKFQVQGTQNEHYLAAEKDTWFGVTFSEAEMAAIAAELGFVPLKSEGAGSQYYWHWWRKPA